MATMVSPLSPHSPRPTRVASYALHFQIPILPMPTPPSLLKRQSSSSSASWSSASSTPSSSAASNNTNTAAAASLPPSQSSSAGSTPLTTPLPRMAVAPASPMVVTRSSPISTPASSSSSWHRRSDSAPSAPSSLPSDVPYTPYSTPLDTSELSFPAFSDSRPPILRRDTPRPGARSRHSEVDEFEVEFGRGLGFDMSN